MDHCPEHPPSLPSPARRRLIPCPPLNFFLYKTLFASLHVSSSPNPGAVTRGRSSAGAPRVCGTALAICAAPAAGSRPATEGRAAGSPQPSPGTRCPRHRRHVWPSADGEDDSAGSCRAPKIMTKTISSPSSSLSLIISSEFN